MEEQDETGSARGFCYLADYDSPQLQKHSLNDTVGRVHRRWVHMLVSGSRTRTQPVVDLCLHGRVFPAFNNPAAATPADNDNERKGDHVQASLADCRVPEGGLVLCETYLSRHRSRLTSRPKHTILPLPPTPLPELDERTHSRAFRTKWDLQSIGQAIKYDGLGVRVVRVAKDQSSVELLMAGPPGSFYEGTPQGRPGGGTSVIAYPRDWVIEGVRVRMKTPVYHPTIGPQGEVAIIMTEDLDVPHTHSSLPALRSLARQLATYAFAGPHADALIQCCREREATFFFTEAKAAVGKAMRQFYEDEWLGGGEERAREMARQWTWHYATPHGEAYHRDGLQCTTVAQLASLIAVNSQVKRDVTMALLVLRRLQTVTETSEGLPAELVVEILKYLASHHAAPPSPLRPGRMQHDAWADS